MIARIIAASARNWLLVVFATVFLAGAGVWAVLNTPLDAIPDLSDTQVIVYTTLLIPVVIVTQATLSFLGLGLPPPTADWGGMISGARNTYTVAPWYIGFPGIALIVTTLAFNLFGDGVADAFDPRADRLTSE